MTLRLTYFEQKIYILVAKPASYFVIKFIVTSIMPMNSLNHNTSSIEEDVDIKSQ